MSIKYDNYLSNHVSTVYMAASWFIKNDVVCSKLIDILPKFDKFHSATTIMDHDISKHSPEEYYAYDNYFYGEQTPEVIEAFNKAWLHHIHNNPHHWQHWILLDDDGEFKISGNKIRALEMPDDYIFEMICDWWSFSWKCYLDSINNDKSTDASSKLYEIFDWYKKHEGSMLLGYETRNKVEKILELIKTELDSNGYSPNTTPDIEIVYNE